MVNIILPANKNEPDKPLPCLYRKAVFFIEAHAKRKGVIKNGIVPYPDAYHTLSTMFHLGKDEAIELFEELKGIGILEVVPFHGIRIIKNRWGLNDY